MPPGSCRQLRAQQEAEARWHANLTEAHGLKLAIPQLRECRQIVDYVHDNDGKARKIIEDSGWGIREYLGPGHALKCFEKRSRN